MIAVAQKYVVRSDAHVLDVEDVLEEQDVRLWLVDLVVFPSQTLEPHIVSLART